VQTIVVLIHEGGFPTGDYNECPGISGPIVDIVKKLDKSVGLIVSGHTHRAYNCQIDGRLVTSADKYGTMLSEIDLQLDRSSGRLLSARADNLIVRTDSLAKDPAMTRHIAAYETLAAPLAKRMVGRVSGPLSTSDTGAGESALGRVIADAQLAAMQSPTEGGAQIALMNPGGIRAPLLPQPGGIIQYEDIFLVQPFYNQLITVTLTGAQLLETLEQQWVRQPAPRLLQVSRGFFYAWDPKRPVGSRVVPGSATLNGQPLQPAAEYRVVMNAFLAQGGDNFTQLKLARNPVIGPMDVDALEQFIAKGAAATMPSEPRIRKVD
jgi:5'-nucleotidase